MKPNGSFEKFKALVQPGDVIFISEKTFLNDIITEGQEQLDQSWTSTIGHAAWINKPDAKGNMQISESTIAKGLDGKWKSGLQTRNIDSWKDYGDLKWLIIMRIEGANDPAKLQIMFDESQRLEAKGLKYPIRELVGTLGMEFNYNFLGLFKIFNKSYIEKCQADLLKKHNKMDSDRMYCVSYCNHVFEKAGMRLIPSEIDESVCKVGDGFRNHLAYKLYFIFPENVAVYSKPADGKFNLLDPRTA